MPTTPHAHSETQGRKTRVLFVCHDGRLYGSQKSLELLVTHLPKDQYEVMVSFAREGPLMERLAAVPGVNVVRHSRLAWAKHTQRAPLKRLGDIISLALNLPRLSSLMRHIAAFRPDIVHSNSLASLEGVLAAKWAGVPHVWHVREIRTDENPRFNMTLGQALSKALIVWGSRRVICISEYVARQFTGTPRPPVVIIPNAIETGLPLSDSPKADQAIDGPIHLAYAGRVSEGKRFQDVIAALSLLKKTQTSSPWPWVLHVYGEFIDPAFEAQIKQAIEAAQLTASVIFEGYVTDLDSALRQCDVLIMPTANEAFGRVLLDAFAAGLPVIVPRGGAAPEIVREGETGFFYTPHNPVDLAQCLNTVLTKRTQLGAMGRSGRGDAASLYGINQQITTLCQLYQACLKECK